MINATTILAILLASTCVQAAETYDIELAAIAANESTNGVNLDHQVIKTGMNKGTRAGGWFGLMPLTVRDLLRRSPRLSKKYGYLNVMTNDGITSELNKNRRMDKELAMYLWRSLRKRFAPDAAAFAWLHGPGKVDETTPEELDHNEYVTRFRLNWLSKMTKYESAKNP